jgi:polyphosphate kinase 2 (PPK2 family)
MPKSSNGRKPSTHEILAEELKRYIEPFRTDGSQSFRLKSQKTCETGGLDRQTATEIIERNRVRLAEMQKRLYAAEHWAVLLILQGMDAAGKDSAIKHNFHLRQSAGRRRYKFQDTIDP